MKNIIIIFLTILILSSQEAFTQPQVKLGLKGGVNINSLYWQNLPANAQTDTKSFTSYHIGLFAKIRVKEKFFIIPELEYFSKGFKTVDSKIELDYVDLPIVANFAFTRKFSLEVGPEIGYRVSATQSYGGKIIDINQANIPKVDFGFTTGVRYGLLENLSAIARYSLSATALASGTYNNGTGGISNEISIHNQNIQFSLAYLMR